MRSFAERFWDVISQQMGILDEGLPKDPGTRLEEDLGVDSIDCVEIIMELEEEFDINLYDHELQGIITVGELMDLVKGKITEKVE